jgi:hypothetical protein
VRVFSLQGKNRGFKVIPVTWIQVNTILLKTAQEWNYGISLFAMFGIKTGIVKKYS